MFNYDINYMKDLRESKLVTKEKSSVDVIAILFKYKRVFLIIGVLFIIANVFFNPVMTATIISNWVNDFIGTFIKTINL